MSSIRLYVLSSLVERGPLHGHALAQLAAQEHVHEWTEISVGALYGALKRMHADGLVAVERTEREGNYPERHVYRITEAGESALVDYRSAIFGNVDLRPDPFDLALSRLDPDRIDELSEGLRMRRDAYQRELDDDRAKLEQIGGRYLWLAERLAWEHKIIRAEAELAFHDRLIAAVPDIIADERTRRAQKGQKS